MKQTDKKGIKNEIGAKGEEIACIYLKKQGFTILEQNYLKKWGEIDIVARETINNQHIVHFIEVKTVSYETKADLKRAVSYGTWRPEENVHHKKLQRLHRAIESWLMGNDNKGDWQVDVAAVRMVLGEKYASIKYIGNIIE